MLYTTLGPTGLTVSRLCLGCMTFGDPAWRAWVLPEDAAQPFFRRAIETGINFFDTADMYSRGVSEEVTGRALRAYGKRDELVIATKVFYPVREGPNMRGLGRKHVVQACEDSLRRLGVDVIDLYQIHRFDARVPIDETLAALDHLVHSGKVRYIGASSGYAWELMRALSVSERNGWARFASMQNHYNLLYREEEREMLPLCRAEGLGVIPWSPLARGRLARPAKVSQSVPTPRAELDDFGNGMYADQVDWAIVDAVEAIAGEHGVSMAAVSLAWLLAKPGVTAPIVGVTKLAQLDDALSALELVLTPEDMARLESGYRPHPVLGH